MKKAVLIPDSFKGTMSSLEICEIMGAQIKKLFPEAEILPVPVADGGEGTVDAFLTAVGGEKISLPATGPFFETTGGFYGRLNETTAVVEMAACAGLPLAGDKKDPERTTTYGVGELILHAARAGCSHIIAGLGGSCTNDGGAGAAAAAGVRFYNQRDEAFIPTGGTLKDISRIDASGLDPCLKRVTITAMCDIDNPLTGKTGAASVFAPQKGADEAAVKRLDEGLAHLAGIVRRDLGFDMESLPGAGAAGGMGGGMAAFFGAKLQMGIETVLDAVSFDKIAEGADWIFTGEGKIDGQSLRGKVVVGVARRAKALGVPVAAVVGDIGDDAQDAYSEGVTAIFSINRVAVDFSRARLRSKSDMALTMDNLCRFIKACGK